MRISVQMMSGLTVELLLAKDSTIADVKGKLHRQWNIKADQQILLCPVDSRPLEDEERVISLVDWFVMEDIVDPFLMKTLYFEVVLNLTVIPHLCHVCSALAHVKCGRCRRVRYCTAACQWEHWPNHKLDCRPCG